MFFLTFCKSERVLELVLRINSRKNQLFSITFPNISTCICYSFSVSIKIRAPTASYTHSERRSSHDSYVPYIYLITGSDISGVWLRVDRNILIASKIRSKQLYTMQDTTRSSIETSRTHPNWNKCRIFHNILTATSTPYIAKYQNESKINIILNLLTHSAEWIVLFLFL